jgi:regulator of protease activity HflC (stomatin/prohibitin superfamily)
MSYKINVFLQTLRTSLTNGMAGLRYMRRYLLSGLGAGIQNTGGKIVVGGLLCAGGYAIYTHPPMQNIRRGEIGVRTNQLTGVSTEMREGVVLAVPGLHRVRRYSLLDQLYRPVRSSKASGEAPFQSVEGLSVGVDLTIRYALDPSKLGNMSRSLPEDINGEIVEPVVQGVIYKTFTRYTVREIFSSKRQEIQQLIEAELKTKLAVDGITLRSVLIGKVDLPQDYKNGMEKLLAEELETEKMRYTLELKEKHVKQTELEGEADKVRREKAAQAAANEQIIAARAQEEAMKHVLPFKQKQIEQRQFEAEAEKGARIKTAEGAAQARRIEAAGEADSRQKLADAEGYRMEKIGKINSAQLDRDGALITKHPLLIQKAMADKLSDKISVIIAPPPTAGGFIGSALLGMDAAKKGRASKVQEQEGGQDANEENQ